MNNLAESKEVQNAMRELICLQDCGPAENFKERLHSALVCLSKAQDQESMRTLVESNLKFMSGFLALEGLTVEQLMEEFFPHD